MIVIQGILNYNKHVSFLNHAKNQLTKYHTSLEEIIMYKKSKAKDTRRMSYSAYRKTLRKMLELCKVPLKRRLSQQECNTIWNMRITLYDATGNYQQIYEDCHKLVNTTLSNHNYQPRVPGKTRHPNAMEHLPYEIKILSIQWHIKL